MAFNGRRSVNVSEYIANLNTIPSAQDIQNSQDNFNLEDDLAMFTNTDFFDFDKLNDADLLGTFEAAAPATEATDMKALDFDLPGSFDFPEFNAFTQPPASFSDNNGVAPPPINTNQPLYPSSSADDPPSSGSTTPASGQKRKAESMSQNSPVPDFEEASRMAAEEDKRRRNTAASARFRVKKKQREQALEKSSKEQADKLSALEGRITQLETENGWLKQLILEKNESGEEIDILFKKFTEETTADRKGSARKDGVGTKA